jgi:hypothetical protein
MEEEGQLLNLEPGKTYIIKTKKHTYTGICKEDNRGTEVERYVGNYVF